MKRKALLFIFEGFCEFEVSTAISMLRSTHDLHTIALANHAYRSEAGLNVLPDITLKEIDGTDYDVLIIPGGDLKPIAEAHEWFRWVANFAEQGKIIAAICSGVYVLAKSKVLQDAPYTVTLTKEQREFLGGFQEANYRYSPLSFMDIFLLRKGMHLLTLGLN
ncbi:DJ-1/PfpI family protein [Heyndrickxia oleronia]|uniref:DJ-1/PfpI family protein n=1 Tax=Heyndrickxia oleronia TaxID=38875 RepID=UPI00203BB888|nr:DJ-1/PfpI family protein [Heyndrickxia oleronia]MCM3240460.1 DJ-1/PfpI family protein [Heyndrickxia oleronia]